MNMGLLYAKCQQIQKIGPITALGSFFCMLDRSLVMLAFCFLLILFIIRNTIRVTNILDLDQVLHSGRPDLGTVPTVCKGHQQTKKVAASVKDLIVYFITSISDVY